MASHDSHTSDGWPFSSFTMTDDGITDESDSEGDFDGEMMRVTVTNDGISKDYLLHKNLLCRRSPYFAASKNFHEGETNHVHLDDMDHRAFRKIIDWIYKRCFRDKGPDDLDTLIKAWAASDRLVMDECKNNLMDLIRHRLESSRVAVKISGLHLVNDLGYSTHSMLVQFLLDQVAYDHINTYGSKLDLSALDGTTFGDAELLCSFIKRLGAMAQEWCRSMRMGLREPRRPSALQGCRYHDHAEGEECYLDSYGTDQGMFRDLYGRADD